MKFFYLAHSEMSLRCLEGLIEKSYVPELVVISLKEGIQDEFKSEMRFICEQNGIELVNVSEDFQQDGLRSASKIEDMIGEFSEFDLGLSVGFMKILPRNVFESPKLGIINLHCGKLPEYRGRAPISRAIMEGRDKIVITVHKIDEGVDSGDIITEEALKLSDSDDVNSIYNRCCDESAAAAIKGMKKLLSSKSVFKKQEPDLPARQTISDKERHIDWNTPVREIFNKIRAVTFPYPGAKANIKRKEYLILHSKLVSENGTSQSKPGEIVEIEKYGLKVSGSNGILLISDIIAKGKLVKDLNKEFKKGDRFSS